MATGSFLAFQKAVYDRLNGDATLLALITGIFDYPDEEQAFPYVTLGPLNNSDFSSHTFDGHEYDLEIHVWTRYDGQKECKNIIDNIYRLLHKYVLTVTGFTNVITWFTLSDIDRDPDGKTYHGIIKFKSLVTN